MNEAVQRRPLGLVVVLVTVVMLFTAFTVSLLVRRSASDWKQLPKPGGLDLATVLLVTASVALEVSRRSQGRRRETALVASLVVGVAFLVNQVFVFEKLRLAGVFLSTGPHASFIYILTALHALHVVGGMIALVVASFRPVHTMACAVYWHVMLAVWVWLLLLLWVI